METPNRLPDRTVYGNWEPYTVTVPKRLEATKTSIFKVLEYTETSGRETRWKRKIFDYWDIPASRRFEPIFAIDKTVSNGDTLEMDYRIDYQPKQAIGLFREWEYDDSNEQHNRYYRAEDVAIQADRP